MEGNISRVLGTGWVCCDGLEDGDGSLGPPRTGFKNTSTVRRNTQTEGRTKPGLQDQARFTGPSQVYRNKPGLQDKARFTVCERFTGRVLVSQSLVLIPWMVLRVPSVPIMFCGVKRYPRY